MTTSIERDGPLEAGIRVAISASVPYELLIGPATPEQICEQSWPEFRRALAAAILAERVRMLNARELRS